MHTIIYFRKLYLLSLFFILTAVTSCMDEAKSKNKIVLLNKDTLLSESLLVLYNQNRITYKQYEGFLIFTSDTIFHNPILITKNSINTIQADILSSDAIKNLLKNSIEKIQYRLILDSPRQLENFLNLLEKKYTVISKLSGSEWNLQDSRRENVGKITYNSESLLLLIELYPTSTKCRRDATPLSP